MEPKVEINAQACPAITVRQGKEGYGYKWREKFHVMSGLGQ